MTPAYEHHGQPCSRERFYAIACDPRRHVAVEACAGAGKTWMLVSRMLRALLAGSAPHEILAITFTKKAAGEMRQRLHEWLADFARARPDESPDAWDERLQAALIARGIEPQAAPDQRQQLQNLYHSVLGHGRPVQIRTFHSWFVALLKCAPLAVLQQLGLPTAFELLEDDADAVAEVWRRYLRQLAGDAGLSADYHALVGALGRQRAHQALESALARRVEFQLADAAGHVEAAVAPAGALYPEFAPFAHPCDALLTEAARERWLARARQLGPEKNKTPQKAAAAVLDAFDAATDGRQRLAALRKAFFVASEDRLAKNLQSYGAAQQAEAELQRLLPATAQHDAHQHHQRMVRLLRPLIDALARLKRERGWVDMPDVERAAFTLLADHELSAWVQQRLDARIRHLLIDEFQDTNPLQWQALHAWLSGYAGAGGGPGAPSVFIVGDPKQSIYRFRRADPQVFADAQRFIVTALGGELLACDHTHRNAPALLQAINGVMGQAQAAGEFSGFRPHTTQATAPGALGALPLVPRPDKATAAGAPAPWRDSLVSPRLEPDETLRTLECRQASRWIAGRIATGVAPAQIMVLARKRDALGPLQAELRRLGIACDQPEKQLLGQQPAVQDVLALVDALLSPGHDLMLARALKSPLFGLGDDDLTRLALAAQAAQRAGQPRPGWLEVLSITELSAHDGQALHADLMQYREGLLTLPPHDALQAMFEHRDVLARFAAAAPAPERAQVLIQLRALLAAALNLQGGRFLTAYQWLRALRRQRLPVPRAAAPGVVQLLTVHGAKGLEADEVLLLDAAAGPPRGNGAAVLIDWRGAEPAPRCLAFLAQGGQPPPSLAALAQQEDQAQAREELNALYVAMTRARQRLVLSGITPHAQPASSWWQRIEPLAEPLGEPLAAPAADGAGVAGTVPADAAFIMLDLPAAPAQQAPAAIKNEATEPSPEPPSSDSARVGEAMHWLLEQAPDGAAGWHARRLLQARRRFGLDAAQAARAEALARRILTGEAAWAWDADEVLEAFNEVELVHQGQRLRIDRLLRRRAGPHGPEAWWVLDYKSAAQPERDQALQAQLERYRAAVQQLHPGQPVQVAFLTGAGGVAVQGDG
ncbi:MAG TPA: UvrD-helicase domain-containing protein [Ottowia sp.]|nr:UvrD-helicase domain-containing protein [Ottowia sp.]